MDDVHHRYPALSRRQVALFERNPVCGLCFRVCLDLSEEYGGGIHFELLQSLEVADSFCERIILNPWDLLEIDQYYHWLERQLDHSKPAVTCAFATISVTLSCMDGLPEPVLQLSHDIRGLIGGGQGGELYDNLRSAARYNDILIHADTYGDIPPQPDLQRELEQFKDAYAQAASEIITLKKQLQMKEQQSIQPAAPVINVAGDYIANQHNEYHTDIHDNHNCPIYACPTKNPETPPRESAEKDNRTKRLFLSSDGIEDVTRTNEECNRFLNYLSDHHWSKRQLDCSRDNPLIKAIVCFCIKWQQLKYIEKKTSPTAIVRFLTDTCGIECASDEIAVSAHIGRLLKVDYDKEVFFDVCDYFI